MSSLRSQIHLALEGDPNKAPPIARVINSIIILMILASVLVVVIESYQPIFEAEKEFFIIFEMVSIGFFTLEFLVRLWASGAAYGGDEGGMRRGRHPASSPRNRQVRRNAFPSDRRYDER